MDRFVHQDRKCHKHVIEQRRADRKIRPHGNLWGKGVKDQRSPPGVSFSLVLQGESTE